MNSSLTAPPQPNNAKNNPVMMFSISKYEIRAFLKLNFDSFTIVQQLRVRTKGFILQNFMKEQKHYTRKLKLLNSCDYTYE